MRFHSRVCVFTVGVRIVEGVGSLIVEIVFTYW